jgi:hypothetical protein
MKLDMLGLPLHEGLLFTLGSFPGSGLWTTLGRLEAGLCRIFASAYPSRPITHFSSKNWPDMANSGINPGTFLINMDVELALLVLGYAATKDSFCLAGLYTSEGKGRETLLTNLPANSIYFDLSSVDSLYEPLKLISTRNSLRAVLSLSKESLGKSGNLLGVRL